MIRRFLEWLLGCPCPQVVPPPPIPQWEYVTLWFTSQAKDTNVTSVENSDSEHVKEMCLLGKAGWELVNADLTRAVFKRQKKT